MTQPNDSNPTPDPDKQATQGVSLPKIVDFQELSRCGDEVWIGHKGTLYRLRCTKQGKLILTK
ncbi:MAG: hypothetical protein Aurels2KO_49940 [Aureliella sp.]